MTLLWFLYDLIEQATRCPVCNGWGSFVVMPAGGVTECQDCGGDGRWPEWER